MDKESQTNQKVHIRNTILGVIGFVTVIGAGIILRFAYGYYLQYELDLAGRIAPMDRYYDPAYIGDSGYVYCNYFTLKGMYLTLCSCAFKFMGNLDGTVIILNILLELIPVVLIYFAVKNVLGRLWAFIIALLCDAAPLWGELPMLWGDTGYYILFRENRLIFLGTALLLFILSLIIRAVINSKKKAAASEAEAYTDSVTEEGAPSDDIAEEGEAAIRERLEESTVTDEEIEKAARDALKSTPSVTIELLKSPLPLPKRHEHRDIDYDHEVRDEDMKYDIEPTQDMMHYDYE